MLALDLDSVQLELGQALLVLLDGLKLQPTLQVINASRGRLLLVRPLASWLLIWLLLREIVLLLLISWVVSTSGTCRVATTALVRVLCTVVERAS